MTDDPIPETEHLARYCKKATANEKGRVGAGAFLLRENEQYLPVDWVEKIEGADTSARIARLRQTHHLTRRKGDLFAILNVEQTQTAVHAWSGNDCSLRYLHQPLDVARDVDQSHSGIFDTGSVDEQELALVIADSIVSTSAAHNEAQ